jgi:DNA-directed RNA polymerase subunit beta'
MLRFVEIDEPNDMAVLPGTLVDRFQLEEVDQRLCEAGGRTAHVHLRLVGITELARRNPSWVAAAFVDAPHVLSEAALAGRVDPLLGIRENLAVGNPMPAGSGFRRR